MTTKSIVIKRLEAATACALILTCIMSTLSFGTRCEKIRGSVLRMHVIANSDSERDQNIKLSVRDAVLNEGAELFDGSVTVDDARERLEPYTVQLENAANLAIAQGGEAYTAKVVIGEEYFNTRTYENVTLPAGRYTAVRVIIGDGGGKNWWCVMFPPMCLPAASEDTAIDAVLDEDGVKIVQSNPQYEIRFKTVELFEKIRDLFR